MSETKYLTDTATRQEHLSDLSDWLNVQINVWSREFKQHHSPDDRIKLAVYEAAMALLKGYVDSFTKDIPTDVEEPKIERARLGEIDTRYNHLVTLMMMWRDAAEFIKNNNVGKIIPTADLNKIRMFEKTVEIVEIYQENLTGEFDYAGVSKTYPSFKDGQARLLRTVLDDAGKAGLVANKKRLLNAANEKAQGEKEVEGEITLAKGQIPSKDEEDSPRIPDAKGHTGSSQDPDSDEPGFASVT